MALSPSTIGRRNSNLVVPIGPATKPPARDSIIDPNGNTLILVDTVRYFSMRSMLDSAGNPLAPTDSAHLKDAITSTPGGGNGANDVIFTKPGTGTPAYAGGGWDFSSGIDGQPMYGKLPSGILAPIAASTLKYWVGCLYVKLPSSANWPAFGHILNFANGGNYSTTTDLYSIELNTTGGVKQIKTYRSIASAGANAATGGLAGTNLDPFLGQWVQLLTYQTAGGTYTRISLVATPATVYSAAIATYANNTGSFGANTGAIGLIPDSATKMTGAGKSFRFGRFWLENLAASGRNPITLGDQDLVNIAAGLAANPPRRGAWS